MMDECTMCGDELPAASLSDGYPFCSPECEESFEELECK